MSEEQVELLKTARRYLSRIESKIEISFIWIYASRGLLGIHYDRSIEIQDLQKKTLSYCRTLKSLLDRLGEDINE